MARYKINIQKSISFLYISIEKSENEIKKTIYFYNSSKKSKILVIKLIKEVQNWYTENGKTLEKYSKE